MEEDVMRYLLWAGTLVYVALAAVVFWGLTHR